MNAPGVLGCLGSSCFHVHGGVCPGPRHLVPGKWGLTVGWLAVPGGVTVCGENPYDASRDGGLEKPAHGDSCPWPP